MKLPLFPLKTVLLPGNRLQLKIFEARYNDMVAQCMREHKPFGVVQIYRGEETDKDLEIFTTGTTATIIDWQPREDGLLGITVEGMQRFQILSSETEHNGLLVADVEILHEEVEENIPGQYFYMHQLLGHIKTGQQQNIDESIQDFNTTLYQLIYLLPLENELKQQLLEVPDNFDRAAVLHAELIRLGIIQYIKPGA